MLVSISINNCYIYNEPVEFSMRANMHYKKFSSSVIRTEHNNILKSAILFGPNNSGKTNFVKVFKAITDIMLDKGCTLKKNIFGNNDICETAVRFVENDSEYLFELKYDVKSGEYVYERFAAVSKDKYQNESIENLLIRDITGNQYFCVDGELSEIMKVASRKNILIYLVDAEQFPMLKKIKNVIVGFASRVDFIDMNNIPIRKTIDMLKADSACKNKIVDFILNADLSLEDYRFLTDDELKIRLDYDDIENSRPQESALNIPKSIFEMLHLVSFYKGYAVPSIIFDSTGTKKMAALASYVVDALQSGRILVVDELDNSLHFKLTRAIISLFNNELNNSAQLISTAHDVSLLDCKTLFRKEQIWFTFKDSERAYLYSLAEFTADKDGIRDTTDILEKYKHGFLGAVPEPDLFSVLLGEEK